LRFIVFPLFPLRKGILPSLISLANFRNKMISQTGLSFHAPKYKRLQDNYANVCINSLPSQEMGSFGVESEVRVMLNAIYFMLAANTIPPELQVFWP
jgi:hypothetical protein